jgi:pyruvate, water dikinase
VLVPLGDALRTTCGGKADALGALLRAGLPVPDGFVLPFATYRAVVGDLVAAEPAGDPGARRRVIEACRLPAELTDELARGLAGLGNPPVAVRSSADGEDTDGATAAGQHESVLAVHGTGPTGSPTPSEPAGPRCTHRVRSPTAARRPRLRVTSRSWAWSCSIIWTPRCPG